MTRVICYNTCVNTGESAMMEDATKMERCLACGAATATPATYCSRCGKALNPSQPPASSGLKWYQNFWFVLLLLFFVLGPFGLPLVWKNPRFSRAIKILLTLVMVVYTVVLVQLTIGMFQAVTREVNQFNSTLSF